MNIAMTALEQDLLDLERRFWTGDSEFYHRHLDEKCLTVLKDVAAVFNRDDIAAQAQGGHAWKKLAIAIKGLVQPSEDVAIMSYEVSAERPDGAPHKAIASTGYVKRYGDWKMAFHQQTPLAA